MGKFLVYSQITAQIGLAILPFSAHSGSVNTGDQPLKWYQTGNLTPEEQQTYQRQTGRLGTVASILAQDDATQAAEGMARSAATGALNSEVSGWLNQFGTARLQLNLDDKYTLNGSQADMLLPVYESDNTLLFSQLGLRRLDQRTTGNLGVGARTFTGDWMFGVNSFLDNDFSGNNRRIGVGVEAWRDYLKLSANSYMRLTDWHQSRDFADHDERPANGWDIRAEGWLPSMPQLGAKLMMEQFKGDDVALFGKDNRQKNPWALTGGVSYTPVPLITLGAEHRVGSASQQDSQINLAFNYRIGEPWHKQINPDNVGAARLLNGSRYDLVERNNSIVLDYRKHDSVMLVLPEKASGKSRSVLPLSFTVKNGDSVQRISWSAPALIAAGGIITPSTDGQVNITLPAWQVSGNNLYALSGTVYDAQGRSHSATVQVTVEIADINADASSVSATPPSIIANGTSTSVVRVTLLDADSQPVTDMAPALKMALQETLLQEQSAAQRAQALQQATIGAVTETQAGVYEAIVTSGTRAGSAVVTPAVNGTALKSVTIALTSDGDNGAITGGVKADTDTAVANDNHQVTYTVVVKDENGNPVKDAIINWSTDHGKLSGATSSTDANGVATITLTATEAGPAVVSATLGSSAPVHAAPVNFIPDRSTASISGAVTYDNASARADGSTAIKFTATVKDAHNNLVPGVTISWGKTLGTLSGSSSDTGTNGQATISLTSTEVGEAIVSARIGNDTAVNAGTVHFITGDHIANGDVTRNRTTAVADGSDTVTYSALARHEDGTPAAGVTVNWSSDLGNLSATSSVTNASGVATNTLTSSATGQATVSASVGTSAAIRAAAVSFVADGNVATGDIAPSKTSAVADGSDTVTYTAIVKDSSGNRVPGATVNWTTDKGDLSANSSVTNSNGEATIRLTSTVAAVTQVSAQVHTHAAVNAPQVTFSADQSSAEIAEGGVGASKQQAIANGSDGIVFSATVKDAHNNLVSGMTVKWATDNGTLSNATSVTGTNGVATITLTSSAVTTAQITAQLGDADPRNAPEVNFIADETTAYIANMTTSKWYITGTGTEEVQFLATVEDYHGNPVAGVTINWTKNYLGGTLGGTSSVTNENGVAAITLTAPVITAVHNSNSTVTAHLGEDDTVGSGTNVGIRTVLPVNGKYYWTMKTDHETSSESEAAANCANYGGGRLMNRADVADFGTGKADFAVKDVFGEFNDGWYKLAGEWSTASADLSSAGSDLANFGSVQAWAGGPGMYVCVKAQ